MRFRDLNKTEENLDLLNNITETCNIDIYGFYENNGYLNVGSSADVDKLNNMISLIDSNPSSAFEWLNMDYMFRLYKPDDCEDSVGRLNAIMENYFINPGSDMCPG